MDNGQWIMDTEGMPCAHDFHFHPVGEGLDPPASDTLAAPTSTNGSSRRERIHAFRLTAPTFTERINPFPTAPTPPKSFRGPQAEESVPLNQIVANGDTAIFNFPFSIFN